MTRVFICVICMMFSITTCFAQWNEQPGENTLIYSDSDAGVDYMYTAVTPNNSIYMLGIYFDVETISYRSYLQLVAPSGEKKFGDDGFPIPCLKVEMGLYSPTLLIADKNGNAVVAVREVMDNTKESYFRIYKISPEGEMLWGENGVTLNRTTQVTDFKAMLNMLEMSDGSIIFSYSSESKRSEIYVEIEKLSADGEFEWNAPIKLSTPSDIVLYSWLLPATDDKFNVIYTMNKHYDYGLRQYNIDGEKVWDKDVIIYDRGFDGQPIYTFSDFDSDDRGGVFAAWRYSLDPSTIANYTAQAAYVDVNGNYGFGCTEKCGISLNTSGNADATVKIAFNSVYNSMIACYFTMIRNTDNLVLQKVGLDGSLLWGENGLHVAQLANKPFVKCLNLEITPKGDIIIVYKYEDYDEEDAGKAIYALCLSGDDGRMLWNAPLKINNKAENISYVETQILNDDFCVVSWIGDRSSKKEVYMQPIYYDGRYDGSSVDTPIADEQNCLSVTSNFGEVSINVVKAKRGDMKVCVYNADGRLITEINEADAIAGEYQYQVNLSRGIYVVQFVCDGILETTKCIVY